MSHQENYYIEPDKVTGRHFILQGKESKHAIRVCRNKVGDEIAAVDGRGNTYRGKIDKIQDQSCQVEILETTTNANEPKLRLTLAHALPKASQFDLVVEKGTEIGICAFVPLVSQYSIGEPSSRLQRWRKKALAAMKQCLRSYCPPVYDIQHFNDYIKVCPRPAFIALESEDNNSISSLHECHQATLFVGPEGGFSDKEIEYALSMDINPLYLGTRRLKSETAAVVGVTKLFVFSRDI
jgi:16S rRNA (uracil1498-N3)-methyltransferase